MEGDVGGCLSEEAVVVEAADEVFKGFADFGIELVEIGPSPMVSAS